jgi:tRNA-modifying protein YgfZ
MPSSFASLPVPDGVLRLSEWGLIRATGPDARNFLHGQLTQDMLHLDQGQARLAGFCSAKGRLLASFVVWLADGDEVLLACSADLLTPTLKRLSMFVLRAKCKLSDASADRALWGAVGASALSLLDPARVQPWQVQVADGRRVIRLPDALVDGQPVVRCLVEMAPDAAPLSGPPLNPEMWQALEVRSGVARIVSATSEHFVPQMVNLELVGGVNFQKGCYPGQEVVARSQYRGTLKRRAFALSGAAPMLAGQEIFHQADPEQPAGEVVLAGQLRAGRHEALAELKLQATASGSLHLGSADGPVLDLVPLPYALPVDAG